MSEALIQAMHSAEFTVSSLREALHKASPVEALLLLPMISAARQVQSDIAALLSAKVDA
jgi:hypothetical protein